MFKRLEKAYNLGKKESRLYLNRFWFGHQMNSDGDNYLHSRERWDRQINKLKLVYNQLNILEKISYKIGDELEDISIIIPLKEPLRIFA